MHPVNRRIAVAIFPLMLFGCVQSQPPFHPPIGDLAFQQTSFNALHHPTENPQYRQFSLAYHGDREALHAYFLEALRMCDTPLIDGEGSEGLHYTFETLLARLGDKRFATALSYEAPRARSAVGHFIASSILPPYPKTSQILHDAPKIDFPLDKAYRDS